MCKQKHQRSLPNNEIRFMDYLVLYVFRFTAGIRSTDVCNAMMPTSPYFTQERARSEKVAPDGRRKRNRCTHIVRNGGCCSDDDERASLLRQMARFINHLVLQLRIEWCNGRKKIVSPIKSRCRRTRPEFATTGSIPREMRCTSLCRRCE